VMNFGIQQRKRFVVRCKHCGRNVADGVREYPFAKVILLPILQHLCGATYDDMRRMNGVLWESTVDWTQVRSPYISSNPPKGHYRFSNVTVPPHYRSITAADMATALLDIAARSISTVRTSS
jgi:hypothetical protein